MTDPSRFPVGTRVRIVALPSEIADCRHIIGDTGTVEVIQDDRPSRRGRTITVAFDPDPEKPDATGFWTFAPEHLEVIDR